MATLADIEEQTKRYADARDLLASRVQALQDEIEQLKRRRLAGIKKAADAAQAARAELEASVEDSPEAFTKPKTRIFSGIRIGFAKQKGKVVVDDEEKTIKRIRERLPKDQADLLIRVRESVDKNAVGDLTTADLKRLGIRVTADTDAVVIKATDTEVDKLVDALLADAERIEEAA